MALTTNKRRRRKLLGVVVRSRIRKIHSVLNGGTTRKPAAKAVNHSILPVLAIEVFQQTLRELGIPLYVVDGEADAMIVQIANHYTLAQFSLLILTSSYSMWRVAIF